MTTYDLEILIRTKRTGDDPSPPADSGLKWTELASKVSLAKQAFSQAAATAKQAYAFLKQGAELELARSRFDNLAKSIDTTADALLGKLKAATGGMVSDAELVASASDIINLGLAKTEEQTIRLATASAKLGLDQQQLVLTFANNSKARLDALGLSVEDVNDRMEELNAQGFDGDAFDEAVLLALEDKMAMLGDAADSTAGKLQIMEASLANLKDQASLLAAGALEPAVSAAAGVAENTNKIVSAIQDSKAPFGDMLFVLNEVNKAFGGIPMDDYINDLRAAEINEQAAIARSAEMSEYYKAQAEATQELTEATEQGNVAKLEAIETSGNYADSQYDLANASNMASLEIAMVAQQAAATALAEEQAAEAARVAAEAVAEMEAASGNLFMTLSEGEGPLGLYYQTLEDINGTSEPLRVNQDALADAMINAASAGGASAAELALLKVATGQLSEAQAEAVIKQVALEQMLQRLGEQYADGTLSLNDYMVAAQGAVRDVNAMTVEFDTQAGSVATNNQAIGEYVGALNQIPAEIRTHISVTSDPIPNMPGGSTGPGVGNGVPQARAIGGPFSPSNLYRVGEGDLPEVGMLQSSGKLFMIPGERGTVFSNADAKGMMGGYSDNSQTTINNYNMQAAAVTNALVQERRRARLDSYMGVG